MRQFVQEKFGRTVIVVGMQYGSEGKGAVTTYLSPLASMGVRSGASNAGHTIYFKNRKFVMRQIPSVWINPMAKLVIGRGALISLDILLQEIELISSFTDIKKRLYIDYKAHVITESQIKDEQATDLAVRIGSTSALSGEGIGSAMADKALRKSSCLQVKDVLQLKSYFCDTVDLINQTLDQDEIMIIEGTQGLGLSLGHGEFPFVTSRDTSATALAASIGLSTHEFEVDVIGVTRTYPIRVAGNSGPFGDDSQEITWQEVAKRSEAKKRIIEKTSITQKIRRVATFSKGDFSKACQINRPTEIALTFADYLDWSVYQKENFSSESVWKFVEMVEDISKAPVTLIKTGPKSIIDLDWYRSNIIRRIK